MFLTAAVALVASVAVNDTEVQNVRQLGSKLASSFCEPGLCDITSPPHLPATSSSAVVWDTPLHEAAALQYALQELSVMFGVRLAQPATPAGVSSLYRVIHGGTYRTIHEEGREKMYEMTGVGWAARQTMMGLVYSETLTYTSMPTESRISGKFKLGGFINADIDVEFARVVDLEQVGKCSHSFQLLPADGEIGVSYQLVFGLESCSPGAKYFVKRFERDVNVGDKRVQEVFTVERPAPNEPLHWFRSASYLQRDPR